MQQSEVLRVSDLNKRWLEHRRSLFVDSERSSFDCFLEEIQRSHSFPENKDLAEKIIFTLKRKFDL